MPTSWFVGGTSYLCNFPFACAMWIGMIVDTSYLTFFLRQVLLGKANVGKSSLVIRFVTGKFMDHMESTIGGTYEQPCNPSPTLHCYRFESVLRFSVNKCIHHHEKFE